MDRSKNLILKDGKDITSEVRLCKYNYETQKYDVTFRNEKTYACSSYSIEWIDNPDELNPSCVRIYHEGQELFNCKKISVFHATAASYCYICFAKGFERTYEMKGIKIVYSCLNKEQAKNCIEYLRQMAALNELKSEDGKTLLQEQYARLNFVGEDTAMAAYLNPEDHPMEKNSESVLIFPFGGNASQFKAIKNAMENQISVIQGPPGTGKTQTILNIIANLLIRGKTVQIVSNNNSATKNVLEKLSLPKYDLGFLVAALGRSDNKKLFINEQTGEYPNMASWKMETSEQETLMEKIKSHAMALSETFEKQERLAQIKLKLDSLNLEIRYFEQYCEENEFYYSDEMPRRSLKSEILLQLWQECDMFSEKERAVSFWFKIKSAFIYGVSNWSFYKNNLSAIITLLQNLFYKTRREELNNQISQLEKYLEEVDAKGKMDELTDWSMTYLRAKLYERYGNKLSRVQFTECDLWKNANDIIKEYPITLSTTFASRSSLRNVTYDYLIMDEASQVDIATGALALSNARNAVIVGDLKQLPNVVKPKMKKRCDMIFSSFQLPQGYSFSENSFLKSICSIITDVPQTLLREHYRCHPKIIGFCNQKFYRNELIIMTEDHGELDALSVFKTVVGNHRRDHMNQRQIDVMLQETFTTLKDTQPEDIGIIAPYKAQVAAITNQLKSEQIEVATVHKFQGREKDTIVLTTVDDVVTDFSDDPYLLNVAVSRAKKRLGLVVSGNEQPIDSNIKDLISYIEYNNFNVIESKIYSVFDLLYQQYTDARIAYLKKHSRISVYDSENIMYSTIKDILYKRSSLSLNVLCHQSLNMLIREKDLLNDEERRYATHHATHLDFLIYNEISKTTVLAIEVDGFHFHKPGTKQYERDRMKDHILKLYKIPLLRFATNGSREIERIEQFLDEYENGMHEEEMKK